MSDVIAPLADLLTNAFWDDPWFSTLGDNDATRRRVLNAMFSTSVRYAYRYGEVLTSPDHDAVACWLPPEQSTVSTWGMLHCGGWRVPLALGLRQLKSFGAHLDHVAALHQQLQPAPHIYLMLLATHSSKQGDGRGKELLQSVLHDADARALPCYLETFNPRNLAFYERNGFSVVNESPSPQHGIRIWSMRRLPTTR
jgi:ribosomal protein S18 acetylase RimI-like enzyme